MKVVNTPEPKKGILGRAELLPIGVGQVIGAGVVSLVGPAIARTGYSVWLVYALAVIMGLIWCIPILFLTSTVRMSGGRYSTVAGLLGPAPAGFISVSILASTYTCASFPTAMGTYVNSLFPAIPAQWAGIALWTLFFILNLMGVKAFAKVQKFMTWSLIAGLLMFIAVGCTKLQNPVFDVAAPSFFSGGSEGVFLAAMLLFSSTKGYYTNMNYGKDCKNATRDIPWSMLATIPIILVIYCGVAVVAAGVLPLEEVSGKPLTLVAKAVLPPVLFVAFMILGPLGALATTANGAMAQIPYGIAASCKDGWLPKSFANTNKHGAFWMILTFVYATGLIPLLLNLNISVITNNMLLFSSAMSIIEAFAYFRLPKLYPEAWAKARLHVPNPVYYALVGLSTLLNVYVIFRSLRSLTPALAAVSILLLALCAGYIFLRSRKSDMTVYSSMWAPSEEDAPGESA